MTGLPGRQLRHCLTPLLSVRKVEQERPAAAEHDLRQRGRVRFLTRVIASSKATWQVATRAEQAYSVMRRLDDRTITMVCLYVSLLNGCQYCIDDAAGAALEQEIPVSQLLAFEDLSEAKLDDAIAAKLHFTWWVAIDPKDMPAVIITRLREHVDAEELLELATVVSMKVFWNRFASVLRVPPEGRCTDKSLFKALLDVSDRIKVSPVGQGSAGIGS